MDFCENFTEVRLLNEIVKSCNKTNMTWTHSKSIREDICDKLNISHISFKVRLNRLSKSGILTKVDRGLYSINTEYLDYGKS